MRKSIIVLLSMLILVSVLAGCVSTKAPSVADAVWTQKTPIDLAQFGTITLKQPNTNGGAPLIKAMQNRLSTREFASDNLTLEDLSGILWAAYGINRAEGGRTVPSAFEYIRWRFMRSWQTVSINTSRTKTS